MTDVVILFIYFFFLEKLKMHDVIYLIIFNNIQYKWKVLLYIYTIGSERELVVSKLARPVQ